MQHFYLAKPENKKNMLDHPGNLQVGSVKTIISTLNGLTSLTTHTFCVYETTEEIAETFI